MARADDCHVRALDDRPQFTLGQEAMKADPRNTELGRQRLNLAAQRVLADDVQAKIAATVREQAHRSKSVP